MKNTPQYLPIKSIKFGGVEVDYKGGVILSYNNVYNNNNYIVDKLIEMYNQLLTDVENSFTTNNLIPPTITLQYSRDMSSEYLTNQMLNSHYPYKMAGFVRIVDKDYYSVVGLDLYYYTKFEMDVTKDWICFKIFSEYATTL